MSKIIDIKARQILDSRGNPTVEAEVYTKNFVGLQVFRRVLLKFHYFFHYHMV